MGRDGKRVSSAHQNSKEFLFLVIFISSHAYIPYNRHLFNPFVGLTLKSGIHSIMYEFNTP